MLNELADRIFKANVEKGWHKGSPDLAKFLMNLHSEVTELWEAFRAGKVHDRYEVAMNPLLKDGDACDKAHKMSILGIHVLTCIEEELADVLIRTLDTAHAFGVDIDRAVEAKMAYNATREHRNGGKLA